MNPRNTKIRANKFKEEYAPSPAGKPAPTNDANRRTVRNHSQMIALSPYAETPEPVFTFPAKRVLSHLYQKYGIGKIIWFRGKLQTVNNLFFNKMEAIMLSEDVFSYKPAEKQKPAGKTGPDTFARNDLWENTALLHGQIKNLLQDIKRRILRRYEKAMLLVGSWLGAEAVQLTPVVFEVVYTGQLCSKNETPNQQYLSGNGLPINQWASGDILGKLLAGFYDDAKSIMAELKNTCNDFRKIFKNNIMRSGLKNTSLKPAYSTAHTGRTTPYVCAANPGYP
jgi:hypothetical protein